MSPRFLIGSILPLFLSAPAWGVTQPDTGTGLQASIAVDLMGSFKAHEDSTASDRFDARAVEMSFFAPIDPLFDGLLTVAAHNEGGVTEFDVHEAVLSTTKLVPQSRIRLGKFLLGIGRLNQIHQHDWAFISAPHVQAEFFGGEGVMDTGLEYSLLMPLPFFLELTVGVTNGWTFGHEGHDHDEVVADEPTVEETDDHADEEAHTEATKPRKPTHYARLVTFTDLPADGGLQVGLNYLARQDAEGDTMRLSGADITAKWQAANYQALLLQSEAWHRSIAPLEGDEQKAWGAYVFPQVGFSKSTRLGIRADYFTETSLKDENGGKLDNSKVAYVPTLTFRPSEFSTLKLAYNHVVTAVKNTEDQIDRFAEIQATFILGAHPSHAF